MTGLSGSRLTVSTADAATLQATARMNFCSKTANKLKYWAVMTTPMSTVNMQQTSYLLQSPAYCFSDSKDNYILLMLCYLFSIYRFFDVPEPIFQKFFTQRGMFWIAYVLWGVHTCPLKIEGQKNNFCPFVDSKSTIWAPPFNNERKIGKSNLNNTVNLWLGYNIHTKHGGWPVTHIWDQLFPWGMGWGR